MLLRNSECIREFEQGAVLQHCDFGRDKQAEYLIDRELPPPEAFRLAEIVLLKARFSENEADGQTAQQYFGYALNYARQVSRGKDMLSKIFGLIIEARTIGALESYLAADAMQSADKAFIVSALQDRGEKRLRFSNLIEANRKQYLSAMQKWLVELNAQLANGTELNEDETELAQKHMRRVEESNTRIYNGCSRLRSSVSDRQPAERI